MLQSKAFSTPSVRIPTMPARRSLRVAADSSSTKPPTTKVSAAEVVQMFKEAQANIIELNKQRLKALDELKEARSRIVDLESQLGTLRSSGGQAASSFQPAPNTTTITILYETGWTNVFAHYNADKKGWTKVPGEQMTMSGDVGSKAGVAGARMLTIPASNIEFVLTNGENQWDTPEMGGGGNYVVSSPGVYLLSKGKVRKI